MNSELWAAVAGGAILTQEPSIVPGPTVVVEPQLTIPPELLERLAPVDPGWFTPPVATIAAACIALGAAVLAWWSVDRQIKANHANMRRQIATQRHLHRESMKVELHSQSHANRQTVLLEASAALNELRIASTRYLYAQRRGRGPEWSAECRARVNKAIVLGNEVWGNLELIGLDDSAKAFSSARKALKEHRHETERPLEEIQSDMRKSVTAARKVFKYQLGEMMLPELSPDEESADLDSPGRIEP